MSPGISERMWKSVAEASVLRRCALTAPSSSYVAMGDIQEPLQLFSKILAHVRSGHVYDLVETVREVSSLDRAEESPVNALSISSCFCGLNPPSSVGTSTVSVLTSSDVIGCEDPLELERQQEQQSLGATDMYRGYRLQRRCGCAGPRPCYWSSHPSPVGDLKHLEHLELELGPSLSGVVGFSVTPYQAFFHPSAPVYGPRQVCLQMLRPRAPQPLVTDGAGVGAAESNYRVAPICPNELLLSVPATVSGAEAPTVAAAHSGTTKLSGDDVEGEAEGASDVCYQSPFFPVRNEYSKQLFLLDSPVLCVGGRVRLVFRGMHRRQMLMGIMGPAEGGGEAGDADGFFMCISHVSVFGVPCDDYTVSLEPLPPRQQQVRSRTQEQALGVPAGAGEALHIGRKLDNAGSACPMGNAGQGKSKGRGSRQVLSLQCLSVQGLGQRRIQTVPARQQEHPRDSLTVPARQQEHPRDSLCEPFLLAHALTRPSVDGTGTYSAGTGKRTGEKAGTGRDAKRGAGVTEVRWGEGLDSPGRGRRPRPQTVAEAAELEAAHA